MGAGCQGEVAAPCERPLAVLRGIQGEAMTSGVNEKVEAGSPTADLRTHGRRKPPVAERSGQALPNRQGAR